MKRYISTADIIIIGITVILFVVALFVKGLTQDLLLEAGILLISVKIILMNYSNKQLNREILRKLEEMHGSEDSKQ